MGRSSRTMPIQPMLARETKSLPEGGEWAFEVKWDGVRSIAEVADGRLRLWGRRGEEITHRYPELVPLPDSLGERGAILDCEIVSFDDSGHPSFQLLQRRMGLRSPIAIERRSRDTPVELIAFDLLELDDERLVDRPYLERRELLAGLDLGDGCWQAPRHHLGDGPQLLEAVRRQGLEGIVAKRADSIYRPGVRSSEWLKHRIRRRQDLVVGGWMPGEGGRSGRLGSLLVGVWDRTAEEASQTGTPQRLVHAGGVGTGFTERTIDQLGELLAPLARESSPFELGTPPKRKGARWCEPRLVCAVEFTEWTREGTLRQPAFKGLRDDVDPHSIVRESTRVGA